MSTRTAAEVLLSLEEKVDLLLNLIKNQEFNNQIISNKLNQLLNKKEQVSLKPLQGSPIFAEAADLKKVTVPEVVYVHNDNIPVENVPVGHRRQSRKETYVKPDTGFENSPIQVPHGKGSKIVEYIEQPKDNKELDINPNNVIPVSQRIAYSDGKAMFMADVNVVSLPNLESVYKTRTGGTGKWTTALAPGKYRVLISHRDRLTKETLSESLDFFINGSENPYEVKPIVFMKNG